MLELFQKVALRADDFHERTEFIIDGFFAKRMITLVYADGGNGKSWLAFALAKYCAQRHYQTMYLDFDNPLSVLRERSVDSVLVSEFPNLHYIHRGKCDFSANELLKNMSEFATGQAYRNHVIIVDSLRNFGDMNNDANAMRVMDMFMNLREAGATIMLLHHSNKDGKNYQGSNNIRNSVDNMYQLTKLAVSSGVGVLLDIKKERAGIREQAFDICPHSFSLTTRNIIEAKASQDDLDFINDVKAALLGQTLSKTECLAAAGCAKDDKTGRARLDKYDGVYWQSTKRGTRFSYELCEK